MAGSRGRKGVQAALKALMEEPGSDREIFEHLLHDTETDPTTRVARALAGIRNYDDRGVAIIFGSLLERNLELALSTHFAIDSAQARRIFSYTEDGPLANLAAKIAMGYALGIYDDRMRSDLRWVKDIRNAFAHARVEVSFATDAVVKACDQLIYPMKSDDPRIGIAKTPRQRFLACVGVIALYLRTDSGGPRRFQSSGIYSAMYDRRPPSSSEKSS